MQVKLLNDEISERVRELFGTQLIKPVELIFFTNQDQCETCSEASQLFEELTELSDKIGYNTYAIEDHAELTQQYNVENTPALVICAREQGELIDYGIRFLGIPSGYEFSSLIQTIELVSRRDSGLKPETRKALQNLHVPLKLKVFVTPT